MDNQSDNQVLGGDGAIAPQFSVGAALREAREQLGLSVADVANRIKFAPRQIEAMEADDFAHLPEATFVRGFVRSYARLLEIDAAPLLAALPQTHQQPVAATEKNSVEVVFPSVSTARRSNIIWLAGGVFVALLLVVFARMHDSPSAAVQSSAQTNVETLELPVAAVAVTPAPVADAPSEGPTVLPTVMSKPAVQAAAPDVKAQSTPSGDKAAKEQLVKQKVIQEPSALDRASKKQAAKEQAAQELAVKEQAAIERAAKKKAAKEQAALDRVASAPKPVNGAAELASLRLVFDEDSWVDVKDASGKILLSKMNHAGSLVRLSGMAPLSIVIGHASGVHLFYKGKEVNLVPHTSVEVARLLLE